MIKRSADVITERTTRQAVQALLLVLMVWVNAHVLFAQTIRFDQTALSIQRALYTDAAPAGPESGQPAASLYNLIALRVEFQPDTTRFTTGNGTFDAPLFDSLEATVDPLPHNAAYFEAHLQFLSNYVDKVSDGQTQVVTHLVPEIIQLSGEMGSYSPTGLEANSDAELQKLLGMVDEAWRLADAQASLDVSQFDPATTAFVIFHAGVGRDIELVGTTLDKTPQDIPTIYFNDQAITRLNGVRPSFKGLSVNHTILMPRTETRQGFDFIQDQPFLVEFSINGLLAASFFNYLGVPDLFNAESGESAIGPFGLMDPLGLFAFNGLFPPEPSGWTKKYLGWVDPVLIEGDEVNGIVVQAASGASDGELIQIPISESEYFLVENRYRDIGQDGLNLTIYRDGSFFEQRIENGQENFNSLDIEGFEGGVVVDVDDFDWALPGGVDEDDNPLLGGMLIWHIDERILSGGIPANRVNVDPEHRGVDLEEADAAQDLGFPSGNIFGPQAHLGTPFDFFYEGNPVTVITSSGEEISLYQNRFAVDTQPNSNSNAGGNSFVSLSGFSLPGPEMTVDYARVQGESVRLVDTFPGVTNGVVPVGSHITARRNPAEGLFFIDETQGLIASQEGAVEAEIVAPGNAGSPIVLPDGTITFLEVDANGALVLRVIDEETRRVFVLGLMVGQAFDVIDNTSLLYESESELFYALIHSDNQNGLFQIRIDAGFNEVSDISLPGATMYSMASTDTGDIAVLTDQGVVWLSGNTGWSFRLGQKERPGQLVIGRDQAGLVGAFVEQNTGELLYLQASASVVRTSIPRFASENFESGNAQDPVLADLDGDGYLDVVTIVGNTLFGISPGGSLADGFPYVLPAQGATSPLLFTLTGTNTFAIMAGAEDGQIYSFDLVEGGQELPGFPLAAGISLTAMPLLEGNTVYAVSSFGDVRVWEVDTISNVWWGQQGRDRFNSNFASISAGDPAESTDQILVGGEVYNWPNPIRNGQTFFRLTTSMDADILITIIDAAGSLIEVLDPGMVRARIAVDVEWNTNIESGLYYARVEARDASGNKETELIKMAVIR